MSRSFAALLLLAFRAGLCAQDAAVPPLEGTVIRQLWQRLPNAPAQWGQAVADASRMPRRSVAGVLGAPAGASYLRDKIASAAAS